MGNFTPTLDQIQASQAQKEVTANAVMDAESPASGWGRRASACSGLTWGYYGGTLVINGTPTQFANATIALTGSATNYLVLSAAGAVSKVTSAPTGWPGALAAGAMALYSVVTGASSNVTDYTDYRPATLRVAPLAVQAPAYAATVTTDLTGMSSQPLVLVNIGALTGGITYNITNGTDGQRITVRFTQDATGSRVLTAGANLRGSTDIPLPTLTTTANKMDRVVFEWNAAAGKADVVQVIKGY